MKKIAAGFFCNWLLIFEGDKLYYLMLLINTTVVKLEMHVICKLCFSVHFEISSFL